jgi:hypothetical protein
MKLKIILCLALVSSGGLLGYSQNAGEPLPGDKPSEPLGKLLEIHSFQGRPAIEIYMKGFQDMAFNAYLKEGESHMLLFLSLPAMKSQFETVTNFIVRSNRAARICAERNGVGTYDVFWSKDSQRLAIAFMGNFIAGYDCKSGQKIQVRDGLDNKNQCRAIGVAIQSFLDGKDFTEAEMTEIRNHSYLGQPHQTKP